MQLKKMQKKRAFTLLCMLTCCTIVPIHTEYLDQNLTTVLSKERPAVEDQYEVPGGFDFVTNIPDDYVQLYERATDPDNLWIWGTIIASTAILYYYDEEIVDWAQRTGAKMGITNGGEPDSEVLIEIGEGYPLLKVPTTTGSSLYFIGDGTVHIGIMAGFVGYGYFADDNKALSVGSQLLEGLLTVGITTQVIKHITGRQTPGKATQPRGEWDFFPNQKDYAADVANYDAFPSGHLATAMMTVTVLSENYPDNAFILPVGYTLMGLLSFQMLNNGVHWASDYPLALGIGYTFGRIVSSRERAKAKLAGWSVVPLMREGGSGIAFNYKF